jgi:Rps23 Pro-64 3,4-dihydroxylase Tpa1-like proline 4-hydroxylase
MFSNTFLTQLPQLAQQFSSAQPYRHIVVDDFLSQEACAGLVEDFPAFEKRYALNEMGEVGGKAVRMDMPQVSERYAALDRFIQSREFLQRIEQLTGIPDLLYDPEYIGGGTHENVHGQGLDPHVDFNVLPKSGWHRRLNLIVYLNPHWELSWGGNLELEKDPWAGEDPNKKSVLPLLNRCVVFETNEISWHGFTEIRLPETARQITRKSIAIYLYTKTRPAEETVAAHGTVYVPRGLPNGVVAGEVINEGDFDELKRRFVQLRGQLKYLYKRELEYSAQLMTAERALAQARASAGVPLEGFLRLSNSTSGYWPDQWCANSLQFAFVLTRPAKALHLEIWIPPAIAEQPIRLLINQQVQGTLLATGGNSLRTRVELKGVKDQAFDVCIEAEHSWQPALPGQGDERKLAFRFVSAQCE